jgi:hypothetical protein
MLTYRLSVHAVCLPSHHYNFVYAATPQVYVAVLELCLRDLKRVAKDEVVTRWYTARAPGAMLGEGERKLQKAALTMIIRAKMIRIAELDLYIARNMAWPPASAASAAAAGAAGAVGSFTVPEQSAVAWAEFGLSLVRQCVFDQSTQAAAGLGPKAIIKEFANVLDALSRTSTKAPGVCVHH